MVRGSLTSLAAQCNSHLRECLATELGSSKMEKGHRTMNSDLVRCRDSWVPASVSGVRKDIEDFATIFSLLRLACPYRQ